MPKLQSRRDEWLKLSVEEYEGIKALYGTYLRTQVEQYAEYKLAESRIKELGAETDRNLADWLQYFIYAALTALGVTIFTVLPTIIAEETGASDFITQVGRTIGGVLLVFLGHWTVSLLIKEILIHIQYKAVLNQLTERSKSAATVLEKLFSMAQIDYLKNVEKPFGKFPSVFSIVFASLASLAEVGGLILLFTRGDSVNIFLIFILSIVPLFLLWALSFVSAYYEKLPKLN